jgi:hypothetical protein
MTLLSEIKPTEFAKQLEENVMKLQFEKLDGAIRDMIATRRMDCIPEEHLPKAWNPVSDEDSSVAVFDLRICGWRSVRTASLKSMEVFNG